ncbi:hypothetical protein [Paraliobacillus ryukyuensis]|uniref:hypothetical protein n=1 Tax=Paraliobacillus ryukyuensis TaxID=200904 RepID=UPI0015C46F70|nr:hypothetical protein [Paraliobacillus ryukyuensis]
MIRLVGLFEPLMRAYVDMDYLNEHPIILSGEKYQQNNGRIPPSSYQEEIKQTIDAIK